MDNFRVTSAYILELLNTDDNQYYQFWASGQDGKARINVASVPDTTTAVLDWDYAAFQLPIPPEEEEQNYRIIGQTLQIYNVDTTKWHTLYISGEQGNPALSISMDGEE